MPGSKRALARFRLPDDEPVCNLDDPAMLASLTLRPSDVVSRDYSRTKAWARQIYGQRKWVGVRWWSYYDPRWATFGLWNTNRLELEDVTVLQLDDPAVRDASRVIVRRMSSH